MGAGKKIGLTVLCLLMINMSSFSLVFSLVIDKNSNLSIKDLDKILNEDPWKNAEQIFSDVYNGTVIDKKSYWLNVSKSHLIYTDIKIKVEKVFKGSLKEEVTEVTYQGGEVGNKEHHLIVYGYGDPSCNVGDEITVYSSNEAKRNEKSMVAVIKHNKSIKNDLEKNKLVLLRSSPPKIPVEQALGFGYTIDKYDSATPTIYYYINNNCAEFNNESLAINSAFNTWENEPTSSVNCEFVDNTTINYESDDLYDVLFWGIMPPEAGDAPAQCTLYLTLGYHGWDIRFDIEEDWSMGPDSGLNIQGIATHEIGHTLILDDIGWGIYSGLYGDHVMSYDSTDIQKKTLKEGDVAGIQYLYPSDDIPTVTINTPLNNSDVYGKFDLNVSISSAEGIAYAQYMFSDVGDTKLAHGWHNLTQSGGYWIATVERLSTYWPTGNHYITVRARSNNGIYGYDWKIVNANQWMDNNWNHRKKITLNGSTDGALSNYPVPIKVYYGSGTDGTETSGAITYIKIYSSNGCKTDFSDIRFTHSDEKSPLDYWIENKVDSNYVIIWVEISAVAASPSTTDFYIYYGNSDATTTSNGINTFSLYDDFEDDSFDTNKWDDLSQAYGIIIESNGVLQLDSNPGTNTKVIVGSDNSFNGAYRLRTKWRLIRYAEQCGAQFITLCVTPPATNGILMAWDPYGTDDFFIHDPVTNKKSYWYTTPTINQWYTVELQSKSNDAKGLFDNVQRLSISGITDYTDTEYRKVGLSCNGWGNGNRITTEYDWVFLCKITTNEPTLNSIGLEQGYP